MRMPLKSELPYQLILLDGDGTLIDDIPQLMNIDCLVIEQLTGKKPDYDECVQNIRRVMRETHSVDDFFRSYGIDNPRAAVELFYTMERDIQSYNASDGAIEFLEFISEYDVPMHLISYHEYPDIVLKKIHTSGIERFFNKDNISLTAGHKAEKIKELYLQHNTEPSRVLFCGDSASDIMSGKSAGIHTFAILNSKTSFSTVEELAMEQPTYGMKSLRNLKELLERI